jgi:hypothetical protein
VNAVVGLGLIAYVVLQRLYLVKLIRRQGGSASLAWRGVWFNPGIVFGVLLILLSISETAATIYFSVVLLGYVAFICWLVAKGVRSAPEMWRRVRSIGDPEAWRGH